ncbi:MAG: hypothetical protein KDA87_15955 [Planctomycetales bacterium]|nr:hypothetical protein [Planctomycetales bacterium]
MMLGVIERPHVSPAGLNGLEHYDDRWLTHTGKDVSPAGRRPGGTKKVRMAPVANDSSRSDSSEQGQELRDEDASPKCPSCGEPMDLVLRSDRPAWREVFYGPDHPAWFES